VSQFEKHFNSGVQRLEDLRKKSLDVGRNRLLVASAVFFMGFLAVGIRLVDLTIFSGERDLRFINELESDSGQVARANILDRNGIVLATNLPTASLYVDPAMVMDAKDAAEKLVTVFPNMDETVIERKMTGKGRFVWLKRNLSPDQQYRVNRLGIPGLRFQREEKRVQPHGRLAAHVIGLTDIDGYGISGIERYYDRNLKSGQSTIRLSLDIRIQDILHKELTSGISAFRAIGAAGLVMDVRNGEVIAMVSLPDFDPNNDRKVHTNAAFNRVAKGVYEMGSTFKLFTVAMALDSGVTTMKSNYDASSPIKISRFTINDFHAQNRWLSLPEIILYSSNIGAAKIALDAGGAVQREYLSRFGLLNPTSIELPEIGRPLKPSSWRDINIMTIAYGHGLAVTPMQLAGGISGLVNNGIKVTPTLIKKAPGAQIKGERVVTSETSQKIRQLMRLVVAKGTGRKAEAPGYFVGGKTGTAQKQFGGKYVKKANLSSFVGVFPIHEPRYLVLVILDEPQGNKATYGYSTGGWVSAPIVKRVVQVAAPILGLAPSISGDVITLPTIEIQKVDKNKRKEVIQKISARSVMKKGDIKSRNLKGNSENRVEEVTENTRKLYKKGSLKALSSSAYSEDTLINIIARRSLEAMGRSAITY